MHYFGLIAHSDGSTSNLFSSSELEEALARFFVFCIKNGYTTNDAHLRLIKWPSKNFPETCCLDKKLIICGYNLKPLSYT